jgi:hypothetical protein
MIRKLVNGRVFCLFMTKNISWRGTTMFEEMGIPFSSCRVWYFDLYIE